MTDLTPERPNLRRDDGTWIEAELLPYLDGLEAALDAERARAEASEQRLANELLEAVTRAADLKASTTALIQAARDLCNQETDTYPALQKALADVDAGRP